MRTVDSADRHVWKVSQLLQMPSVQIRHPDLKSISHVSYNTVADKQKHWEIDPQTWILSPPLPGDVTPITELNDDHPAVLYLTRRGYDMQRLYDQFQVSFCTKEYPHDKNGIWYHKHMPNGWADTTQGRVIFFALINNARMTWQARYIEYVSDDGLYKYALHPYTFEWDLIEARANAAAPWMRVSPFDAIHPKTGKFRWSLSKYRTATHSTRELMGWDAAVRNAKDMEIPWCVLCEGPLDAARVGPGGIALIGKSINIQNAEKVVKNFAVVYTAFDNDTAGKGATEKITKQLLRCKVRGKKLVHVQPFPVSKSGKDLGDMEQSEFDTLFKKVQRKTKRILGI